MSNTKSHSSTQNSSHLTAYLSLQNDPAPVGWFKSAPLPRSFALKQPMLAVLLCASLVSFIPFESAYAEQRQCFPDLISTKQLMPSPVAHVTQLETEPSAQTLESDSLSQPFSRTYLFTGNAILKQPGLVVFSDQIQLNKTQKTAQFTGHVELHQPTVLVKAEHAHLDQARQTTVLEQTRYQMLPSRIHGQSSIITLNQASKRTDLVKANLTACKTQSGQTPAWDLHFKTLVLDNVAQRAIGHHVTLTIKDVPVFYTPYFDYPLNDRASGLLFPEVGRYKALTQKHALQYISLPYFFNLASNMDDTLTLIPMSERGLILDNEFRYLGRTHNVIHRTEFKITALQDQLTAREGLVTTNSSGTLSYGEKLSTRWRASLNAQQNWGSGLSTDVVWHDVSDELFFADIPVETPLKTVTQVARHLNLTYQQGNIQAYARLINSLRLRNASLNYEKWPELGLNYRQQTANLGFDIHAEATEFIMPTGVAHSKPEALRMHLSPSVEYQSRTLYSHFQAQLVAQQTVYQMHDNGFNNTGAASHNRFIPQAALRGGLVFERHFSFAGSQYSQTLEPELQYLYVPYEDQSFLPLFDTANRSLSFNNIFALNRFTGSDRIGDANQLSVALTTQLLDKKGRQLAHAGMGQIHYLNDRKVALTGSSIATDAASDIFITAGINKTPLYFSTTAQLNQASGVLTNANSRLKYTASKETVLLLNHVLQNNATPSETEILSLGGFTKISQAWQLGAYANYNVQSQDITETRFGLKYNSCCWSTEIIAEHTQLENGLYNDAIQVQFELKGISTSDNQFKNDLNNRFNF